MATVETRKTNDLKPHPENEKIYHDRADAELVQSVREKGILNPLLIAYDNTIINGHRRWDAAKKVGLSDVPVVVFPSEDELDILEALIESNRQRQKTNEQKAREAQALRYIHEKREKTNSFSSGLQTATNDVPKVPYQKIGEHIGASHNFAKEAIAVIDAVDALAEQGKAREAEQLRREMNQSVKKAYERAREAGHIVVETRQTPPKPEPKLADHITLDEWRAMSFDERGQAIIDGRESTRTKFNWQDENNIEWALWSWNPITGCKHNCPYCYARDIAERFYPQKFEPVFLPERLAAPFNTPMKPEAEYDIGYKNVFTCSMADLFGKWVPDEWITAVLDVIRQAPQWNFLFLTKFPIRLSQFDFPDNAWVGTTVDCQARVKNAEDAFRKINAKVKWLSCEPLLEPLQFSDLGMFQWIVLGGSSKSTQTPEWRPPRQWINDIQDKARSVGCMVYEKTNLLERIREYPGQENGHIGHLPEALKYLPSLE